MVPKPCDLLEAGGVTDGLPPSPDEGVRPRPSRMHLMNPKTDSAGVTVCHCRVGGVFRPEGAFFAPHC